MAAVNVIMHYPNAEDGRLELARRAAEVHADAVIQHIKSLNCRSQQKLALLDAVIESVKNQSREQI